ncbi:YIP1 family protein [Gemmatimonadota bacterium]
MDENVTPPTEESAAPPLPSLPSRLLKVFIAPGELFEALKENPAWFGTLLVAAILTAASVLVIPADVMVEATREQLISQGQEVPPGFENMAVIFRVSGAVGGLLGIFIMAFILAGVVKLIFSLLMGDEGTYKKYLSVVSHALVISAVGAMLMSPLRIAQADLTASLSVGTFFSFLGEGYLFRVLKLLDLFGLWSYGVMAIGVSKIDPRRSVGGAMVVFFGLAVAVALIFGIFGG